MTLYIHDYICPSHSNGPGARAVIWTQGCSLACEGCFNPTTHAFGSGTGIASAKLAERIMLEQGIEGITISGGEPFQQMDGIKRLLREIKLKSKLSIIVFTGYSLNELIALNSDGRAILEYIDVLIAGRFVKSKRVASGLIGSSNKTLHFFSSRYSESDFKDIPEAEIIIEADGTIASTGIDPLSLKELTLQ